MKLNKHPKLYKIFFPRIPLILFYENTHSKKWNYNFFHVWINWKRFSSLTCVPCREGWRSITLFGLIICFMRIYCIFATILIGFCENDVNEEKDKETLYPSNNCLTCQKPNKLFNLQKKYKCNLNPINFPKRYLILFIELYLITDKNTPFLRQIKY